MVTQRVELSLVPSKVMPVVYCTQYDKGGYRQVEFEIYDENGLYSIPANSHVYVVGTKKDKTGFTYECSYSGAIVTVDIVTQMTVFSGDVVCGILILDYAGNQIGLLNFILRCQENALQEDTIISETDMPIIELIPSISAVSAELTNWIRLNYITNSEIDNIMS